MIFMSTRQAAQFLNLPEQSVYYLFRMGTIEATKVRYAWRAYKKAVVDYAQSRSPQGVGESAGYYVYPGSGGHLIDLSLHGLQNDLRAPASGLQGRRRGMEYQPGRFNQNDKPELEPMKLVSGQFEFQW